MTISELVKSTRNLDTHAVVTGNLTVLVNTADGTLFAPFAVSSKGLPILVTEHSYSKSACAKLVGIPELATATISEHTVAAMCGDKLYARATARHTLCAGMPVSQTDLDAAIAAASAWYAAQGTPAEDVTDTPESDTPESDTPESDTPDA